MIKKIKSKLREKLKNFLDIVDYNFDISQLQKGMRNHEERIKKLEKFKEMGLTLEPGSFFYSGWLKIRLPAYPRGGTLTPISLANLLFLILDHLDLKLDFEEKKEIVEEKTFLIPKLVKREDTKEAKQ